MRPERLLTSSLQQFDPSQLMRPAAPLLRTVERREGAVERFGRLSRLIDGEIVPRLLSAHREDTAGAAGDQHLGADIVREFTDIILADEQDAGVAYVEALRQHGVSVEAVYLYLLTPAARRLGELWETDEASFVQVTSGVWRMQQILRSLSPRFLDDAGGAGHGRRALILSVPSEQHSFGIVMLSEFFRRAGWSVWGGPGLSVEEVARIVRTERYEVVGFSLACEDRLDTLTACIRRIRRDSMNRTIGVLVGGRVFNDHPEFVAQVGADATSSDARQAVAVAEAMSQREEMRV